MKKYLAIILLLLIITPSVDAKVKRLKVVKFGLAEQRDLTARLGTTAKKVVIDGDTVSCPVVKVRFNKPNAVFEGPVLKGDKPEFKTNEYWVYMMPNAKHLIVKHSDYKLIDIDFKQVNEEIKMLKSKQTYILELEAEDEPKSSFTLAAGFNVMPFLGPTVSAGFMFKNFCVEAGAIYGLSKSADVYIYDKAGALADGYSYTALRGFLRVGYDIWAAPVFAITPQVGAAFNTLSGSRLSEVGSTTQKVMDGATAISGTIGARLMFAPSGKSGALRVFLMPEYDFAVSKDKNFEALSAFDSKVKSWADGLNVNLGLLFYF